MGSVVQSTHVPWIAQVMHMQVEQVIMQSHEMNSVRHHMYRCGMYAHGLPCQTMGMSHVTGAASTWAPACAQAWV